MPVTGARILDGVGARQVPYTVVQAADSSLWIPPDVVNITVSADSAVSTATGSSALKFDDIRPGRRVSITVTGANAVTLKHTAFGSAALAGSYGQYTSTFTAAADVALAAGDTCTIVQTNSGTWIRENTNNA